MFFSVDRNRLKWLRPGVGVSVFQAVSVG
jgi:hypothetical protein